jgi:hypothetical protein
MGGIGKARMIWAVTALMAVMPVASWPCSDTQPGWLSERLSVVCWMGLGLTHPCSADGLSERSACAKYVGRMCL